MSDKFQRILDCKKIKNKRLSLRSLNKQNVAPSHVAKILQQTLALVEREIIAELPSS